MKIGGKKKRKGAMERLFFSYCFFFSFKFPFFGEKDFPFIASESFQFPIETSFFLFFSFVDFSSSKTPSGFIDVPSDYFVKERGNKDQHKGRNK